MSNGTSTLIFTHQINNLPLRKPEKETKKITNRRQFPKYYSK